MSHNSGIHLLKISATMRQKKIFSFRFSGSLWYKGTITDAFWYKTAELLQKLNEYGKAQNEEIDLQIKLLEAEKADIDKRRKNLMAVIEKGNIIDSIVEQIKEMEQQIDKIDDRIDKYETSKKIFTLDDLKFIKDKFTDYVREECNEDVIIFLNDIIDKIQVDDVIDVKLKKNIKVDHDTKKIFG